MSERLDPPQRPLGDSTTWFESGPDEIRNNLGLAALIVRIGMASNALAAHQYAGVLAMNSPPAQRTRGLLNALISAASYTFEAVQLARENMRDLRPLALSVDVSPDILAQMGQLGAGTHAANEILLRARNRIGFHWDDEVIRASVLEFVRNEKVIWLEFDDDWQPLHRLAHDVLAYALLPASATSLDVPSDEAAANLESSLQLVVSAMRIVTEFFVACVYGYLQRSGTTIVRHERQRSAE